MPGPYLRKQKRYWNETLFIDRWQLEEVQCTRTTILPCILTQLSPQLPPTLKDFYTRSYSLHYFLIKGTTGTIFIMSLVWRGPWQGIEPRTYRTRCQHSTIRLSRKIGNVVKSFLFLARLHTVINYLLIYSLLFSTRD